MFYADNPSPEILQGDVFAGLVNTGIIPSNFLTASTLRKEHSPCFSVDLGFGYSTIVTPSCEIPKPEREYLAFCPLLPIHKRITQIEFFQQDPTRFNNPVDAEDSMPKPKWESKSEDEKDALRQKDYFSDYLMIDFNFVFNVSKKKFQDKLYNLLLGSRVLQLSFESQKALKSKLVNYYFREEEI
jgi:hypothetical protein